MLLYGTLRAKAASLDPSKRGDATLATKLYVHKKPSHISEVDLPKAMSLRRDCSIPDAQKLPEQETSAWPAPGLDTEKGRDIALLGSTSPCVSIPLARSVPTVTLRKR